MVVAGSFDSFCCPRTSTNVQYSTTCLAVREAQVPHSATHGTGRPAPALHHSVGRACMTCSLMVAGGVRFAGGMHSFMVDAGGVCACVLSRVIYAARWPCRRPWFCRPRFCRRFLPFPGPPLLSTVHRRDPSGGPLGAGSPGRRRPTILRCRGPRVGPLGARSPARTDRSPLPPFVCETILGTWSEVKRGFVVFLLVDNNLHD